MARITVATIAERQESLSKTLAEHDKILVRGNGVPSLQEDVRNIKGYINEQKMWIKAIALLFLGQFVAVGVSMVVLFIQVIPILQKLSIQSVALP